MSTTSFNGLLIISAIAVAAPILAASVRRVKLPSVVVEIVAGVIVGSSVLGWVRIDQPVSVVALLGLAFLLFLSGLEIDLRATAPSQFRAPLAGFAGSLLLGAIAGAAFHAVGWVRDPFFLAITLAATLGRRGTGSRLWQ
jgi:Kef-type K+ transport system membrane component KefB